LAITNIHLKVNYKVPACGVSCGLSATAKLLVGLSSTYAKPILIAMSKNMKTLIKMHQLVQKH